MKILIGCLLIWRRLGTHDRKQWRKVERVKKVIMSHTATAAHL